MALPHHFRKIARTVFAGEHKVGHGGILRAAPAQAGAYNHTRRAFPHGEAANRVRWGTKQP